MLDSIIERQQGIAVASSVKTSVLENGLLMKGISAILENMNLSQAQTAKYEAYLDVVTSGAFPSLLNVTADKTTPLDEFSVGTQLIQQYLKSGNETFLTPIHALHQADLIRNRQLDGSYWYYVYTNVTTQDGLFSIPAFHSLYAREFDEENALAAYQTSALQFSNIVDRCLAHSGSHLLYHGYDPTRSFLSWGNLTARGHSQNVWGRAVGWTCTGLLATLDAIPDVPATQMVRKELLSIFAKLMTTLVKTQHTSGAWWQVMNAPNRTGNYLESSSTGLFAYSMLRGTRLGYLGTVESRENGDAFTAKQYQKSAEKAYAWLGENAVVEYGNGTIGYNLTVDVCSINSTTAFDYYVAQPLKQNGLLGEVGFMLTDVERQIAKK
ncbi:hypothetical protein BP5796_12105 [Coleophoma crateriformis]|uniref:Uncharacterized protein n=1 Tax=Coleophoma crateriformis TaxID=565419 RepID=A0A3D8QBS3_9HELO|nr:hypothetical protein BP5796_12105 [Coleophoma crateriformis]